MRPIIRAEGLSKRYRIGDLAPAYTTLRETLTDIFKRRTKKTDGFVWALKDCGFEAYPGDVIGIVGRNGAGKSTLLKILSRVTEPTLGRAELYGRVGSLLEVGTGFHPELTGRDNIFLNGSILGMRGGEVRKFFDEIVAFAEVEKFIDTPVKRYSSGMYLRLAFAVAAFLQSEILLVDEVLAVGDANFQKKCLGKMQDVSSSGRTVLFVSHNMAAVEGLCNRCLLINGGMLVADGTPHEIIKKYLAIDATAQTTDRDLQNHPGRRSRAKQMLKRVRLLGPDGLPSTAFPMGTGFSVEVQFDCDDERLRPNLDVLVKNSYSPVFTVSTRLQKQFQTEEFVSNGRILCKVQDLPLLPGSYSIDLYFGEEYQDRDVVLDAICFEVLPADVFDSGEVPKPTQGVIFWQGKFQIEASTDRPGGELTTDRPSIGLPV